MSIELAVVLLVAVAIASASPERDASNRIDTPRVLYNRGANMQDRFNQYTKDGPVPEFSADPTNRIGTPRAMRFKNANMQDRFNQYTKDSPVSDFSESPSPPYHPDAVDEFWP